jgi:chromosomal replication initiation ATPase DnaA
VSRTDRAAQLVLDLGHRPALAREDFLVAPCNEEAVAWLDRWPDWPSSAVILVGAAGAGKSHLARVWRARTSAASVEAASLRRSDPWAWLKPAPVCVVEDAPGGVDEQALLHLLNAATEAEGHLLITAVSPPSRWALRLPDLASRMRAAPIAELRAPDDALLGAVMVKLFADRQVTVTPEVVSYVLPRMERSFAALRALVVALDEAALAQARAVTVPLAREVLLDLSNEPVS